MKDTGKIKSRKWAWLSALMLVFMLAMLTGCNNAGQELIIDEGYNTPDPVTTPDGPESGAADDGTSDNDPEDELCCHNLFEDFGMVVATVNGIGITASDVIDYFGWAIDTLVWDYIAMFPDDTEFDFDKIFHDDMTFGRVVKEYSVRMAAHVRLYYGFAAEHSIEWDLFGQMHPADNVIFAIVADEDMFTPFEQYVPEDTFPIFLEKAEELLERALAGEDFDELIRTYGEDPGMQSNPWGYTFIVGDMVPEFEAATLALEIGEISGLVMTSFGIHIVKRIEPDIDNIMANSWATPDTPVEELLGAKHILILAQQTTEEDRMIEAVLHGFENKLETADIVFLPTLEDIPLG